MAARMAIPQDQLKPEINTYHCYTILSISLMAFNDKETCKVYYYWGWEATTISLYWTSQTGHRWKNKVELLFIYRSENYIKIV